MRIHVLGVGFDNMTMEQAVAEGVRLMNTEGTHYAVTPNPEIVEVCREDPEALAAVNGADLVLADGIGVIYGARMLGTPLKGRVPGIDFASALMEQMARTGKRLFLLGAAPAKDGQPSVAEQAAANLQKACPGLVICGTHDGYFKEDGPVIQQIRDARADVVFVCLGFPRQEKWIAAHGGETGARLLIGLGGSLDVFAGRVKRAPAWFQNHGLEWFYRLASQPSRAGRILKIAPFLLKALGARLRGG